MMLPDDGEAFFAAERLCQTHGDPIYGQGDAGGCRHHPEVIRKTQPRATTKVLKRQIKP